MRTNAIPISSLAATSSFFIRRCIVSPCFSSTSWPLPIWYLELVGFALTYNITIQMSSIGGQICKEHSHFAIFRLVPLYFAMDTWESSIHYLKVIARMAPNRELLRFDLDTGHSPFGQRVELCPYDFSLVAVWELGNHWIRFFSHRRVHLVGIYYGKVESFSSLI